MSLYDRIADDLRHVDAETLRAFSDAARSARFCCEAMESADAYSKLTGISKPAHESSEPSGYRFGWARKRIVTLLRSIASIEDTVAHQLDRSRVRHDGGEPTGEPTGVRGRPVKITRSQVDEIRRLARSGVSVTRIAHCGVMPAGTFWKALRRGADETTGIARELWVAIYGEEKE